MGVDLPDLDDLTFEELVERAQRELPRHSESWTDHSAHDTGIAIIEVLAWLTETYSYELDQLSTAHYEKYLELLGGRRRPPRPETVPVTLEPPAGAGGGVVPAGTRLIAEEDRGAVTRFELAEETRLVEATLEHVVTQSGVDVGTEMDEGDPFYPFGENPSEGDVFYLGFDRDPFEHAETLSITLEYHDDHLPAPASHGDQPVRFEPSVEVRWQYCTSYPHWEDDEAWADLPVLEDETNALYTGGTVTVGETVGWQPNDPAVDETAVLGHEPGTVWIRCLLKTAGYEVPPQLESVRLNVARAACQQTVTGELLRRDDQTFETTIDANQEFFFDHAPVCTATIEVGGIQWSQVSTLDRSGPTDRHYVLNHERGSITFGDGVNGAKPPVNERVVATSYVTCMPESTASVAANWGFPAGRGELPAGVPYEAIGVTPLGPGVPGRPTETVEEALERVRRDLNRPYRATTLEDVVYVAEHTPGLRFGRAHAKTTERELPDGTTIPGIDVVVVPYSTRSRPEPSEGFLEAVRTHLRQNTLVTDVLTVRPPTYVEVGMDLTVVARDGYSKATVAEAIERQLVEYLHPLTGYRGDGWPFGRSLSVVDVTDVVAAVDGVQAVADVRLAASREGTIDDHGNVSIGESMLLAPAVDDIRVRFQDRSVGGPGQGGRY